MKSSSSGVKKILHVTHAIYPYEIGGGPIYCHELAEQETKNGLSVTVMTVDSGLGKDEIIPSYRLIRLKPVPTPWDFMGLRNPLPFQIILRIDSEDYDVVHVHSHLFIMTFISVLMARLRRKPVVLTVHGVRARRDLLTNILQELWIRTCGWLIFRGCGAIICLTNEDRLEVTRYCRYGCKFHLIPLGINEDKFPYSKSQSDYALWTGRFVPEKGILYLVDAMRRVCDEIPSAKLRLVGEGRDKEKVLSQVAAWGMEKNIVVEAECCQSEISRLVSSCMFFVLPSIQEGLPRSLLEAMSSGKAVITTDRLSDVVGQCGIVVPPSNPAALAEALITLYLNPHLRQSMGKKAARIVRERFSLKTTVPRILEVYRQIVNGGPKVRNGI